MSKEKLERYKVVVKFTSGHGHEAPCYNYEIARETKEMFLNVINVESAKIQKITIDEWDDLCTLNL